MAAPDAAHGEIDTAAYILHHVQDSYEWEVPGPKGFADHIDFRQVFGDWSVNLGGTVLDLTPTKNTVFMFFAAILTLAVLIFSMRKRASVPRGPLQNAVEMLFLFVRDEIAIKNIGHDGKRYTPYLATCFFFILAMNMLGLMPYGSTATASISVTAVLALCTFVMTQVAGMRAQGVVGYWAHLVPSGVPWWLYPILLPIEIVGLFTKPFALTMRLFANMVAGHIVLFFLIGLIFLFKSLAVAPAAIGLAFGIFFLEIFVASVQAFVFTLLSAVFIGLASHSH